MADISKISPNGGTTIYDIKDAVARNSIASKQDKLTWDSAPTSGSTNPVTSGGIFTAIQNASGSGTIVQWDDLTASQKSELISAAAAIIEEDIGSTDSMEF